MPCRSFLKPSYHTVFKDYKLVSKSFRGKYVPQIPHQYFNAHCVTVENEKQNTSQVSCGLLPSYATDPVRGNKMFRPPQFLHLLWFLLLHKLHKIKMAKKERLRWLNTVSCKVENLSLRQKYVHKYFGRRVKLTTMHT